MQTISASEQLQILKRGAAEIVPEEEFGQKLEYSARDGRPLRVKLGLDPTASDIHLGFAVVLRKLRQFQDLGHQVVLIIGDRTATIGDPSGRSETRKQLTLEEVKANAATYTQQLFRILDAERTEVRYNSEWLDALTITELITLASRTTVARMLERDDFAKRFAENRPIALHELLYPLCQGFDSVAIRSDVEMGGTDQKFNILMGRELQRDEGQEPQVAFLMPLLVGLDGANKMSKSLGNYIGITESPDQIYGKLMSIRDELMRDYYVLCTDLPLAEVETTLAGHPKAAKQRLGREIVTMYHNAEAALAAEAEFEKVFARHGLPEDVPQLEVPAAELHDGKLWIIELLSRARLADQSRALVESSSEARRLVQQGAVTIDGQRVGSAEDVVSVRNDMVLKVGKRRFARVKVV